jgi:hypothetical protein
MMRRQIAAVCVVGLIGVSTAAVALGAIPPPGRHFSGHGTNYQNQGSSWVGHGTGSFSFRISTSALSQKRYVNNFRATYRTACSSRTLRMFASGIPIRKDGTFTYRFHDSGAWVKIWGTFRGSGRKASVNYLANFSPKKNDNQKNPGSLGCAAWVRGTGRTG